MGAQNSLLGLIGAAGVAASKVTTAVKDKSTENKNKKAEQSQASSSESGIDLEMRDKALKTAQKKIDAINAQNLGRNTRMKQIRGVIAEFADTDFSIKEGGKK